MKIEWGKKEWKPELDALKKQVDEMRPVLERLIQDCFAEFDREVEQMEAQLLERIASAEKLARSHGSLSSEGKPEEPTVIGGYVPWSQRKARRVMKAAAQGFAQKVLKNAQRGSATIAAGNPGGDSTGP